MKKKSCGLDRRWLHVYLDGEFSPAEVRAIESHLEQCPACQQELGWLRATEVALAMVEAPAPPADFTARLMARAVAEGALARPQEERSRLSIVRRVTRMATSGFEYAWRIVPDVSVPDSWREQTGSVVRQGAATTGRGTWRVSRWLLRAPLGRRQPEEQRTSTTGRIARQGAATTGRGAWRVSRWLLRAPLGRRQPEEQPSRRWLSLPRLRPSRSLLTG